MGKRKSLALLLSFILVFSFFLAACSGSQTSTPEPESSPTEPSGGEEAGTEEDATTEGPTYGGDLIWGQFSSPVILNPLYSNDTASTDVNNLVFDRLVIPNESFEPIPRMAENWAISDDNLTFTFNLKQGIKWHDGEDFTADDVVFSLMLPKHPDYTGPRASDFESVETVTALDDYTVEVVLNRPNAKFLLVNATYGILPEHILGNVPVAELGDHPFNYNPIGTGPFTFDVWEDGQYVRALAFDDYFLGRPYLDSITYKIVPDQNTLLAQLQAGDIDMMSVPSPDINTVREWEQQGMLKVDSTLGLSYTYLGYNLRNELFQDREIRQAITHAIDREAIIEAVLDGDGQIAHAPASPLSWAYNPDTPQFNYDPEKAKQILADAGWEPGADGILVKDGKRFSFSLKTNQGNKAREDIIVVVQQFLKEVGIEVSTQVVEWSAFLSQIQAPNFDFDAVVVGWSLSTDPDPTGIWHSKEIAQGNNNIGYARDDIDELIDINTTLLDQAERQKVIWEIFGEIANDQPYTFLYYPNKHRAMPTYLEGFIHHPNNDQYLIHEWWFNN